MGQRLEGRISAIDVRSGSTEKYDRHRNLIALGDCGSVAYLTIETPEGPKVVSYSGSQPITAEIKGHTVHVDIEEIIPFITIKRDNRSGVESECPPPTPTRTRIYDRDANKWYS